MKRFEIAESYALALLRTSSVQARKEAWSSDLDSLVELWQNRADFKRFLLHPEIHLERKKELLEKLSCEREVVRFLTLILAHHHIQFLPDIASKFARLVAASSDTLYAQMVSAQPLPETMHHFISEQLAKKKNKQVKLIVKYNPALMGGAWVEVENQLADFSIKTRLERLKKTLLKDRYA